MRPLCLREDDQCDNMLDKVYESLAEKPIVHVNIHICVGGLRKGQKMNRKQKFLYYFDIFYSFVIFNYENLELGSTAYRT